MTKNNFKCVVPEGLHGNFKFHDVLHCTDFDDASVLNMIHDMSADAVGHVVRLYMLKQENDEMFVDFELEAFAFPGMILRFCLQIGFRA